MACDFVSGGKKYQGKSLRVSFAEGVRNGSFGCEDQFHKVVIVMVLKVLLNENKDINYLLR